MLAPNPPVVNAYVEPLKPGQNTIEVARLALPDYLDTQDILLRNGHAVAASREGRWASRLSLAATDLITDELTPRVPNALVTDEPQAIPPTYRILINVRRLDVTSQGRAVLEANWSILTVNPETLLERSRGRFEATGPAAHAGDVVALQQDVLKQLAAAIDVSVLR